MNHTDTLPIDTQTPVTKPVPQNLMATEPAGAIGTAITTILAGVWLVLKAVGVDFADDLPTAIDVMVGGLLLIPAFTGWLTRFFVVSPTTAQKAVNKAAITNEASDVMAVPPDQWGVNRKSNVPTV